MHWIKTTAPDGRTQYVNLNAVATMMRAEGDAWTALVLAGAVASGEGGRVAYGSTGTRETPEELLALPPVELPVAAPLAAPVVLAEAKKTRKRA